MKARDVKHTSVESPCVRAMAVLAEGVPAMGWESRKPEAALPSRLMIQTCEEESWGQFPAPAPFFDSDAPHHLRSGWGLPVREGTLTRVKGSQPPSLP
jgi:hypothetical protein